MGRRPDWCEEPEKGRVLDSWAEGRRSLSCEEGGASGKLEGEDSEGGWRRAGLGAMRAGGPPLEKAGFETP